MKTLVIITVAALSFASPGIAHDEGANSDANSQAMGRATAEQVGHYWAMDYFNCENAFLIPNKAMREMLIPSHAYATSYFAGTSEFVDAVNEHGSKIACLMFEKSVKKLIKDYEFYMN